MKIHETRVCQRRRFFTSFIQPEILHAALVSVMTRLQTVIYGDGGYIEQVR